MATSTRQRMFLFERAYKDYGNRLRRFVGACRQGRRNAWNWFWRGPGERGIGWLVRLAVPVSGLAGGVAYAQYEMRRSAGITASAVFGLIVVTAFVMVLTVVWKGPIRVLTQVAAGLVASGAVLLTSVASVVTAFVFGVIYLVGLTLLTVLSVIIFVPVFLLEWSFRFVRGITYECQYDDCSSRKRWHNPLPIHVCSCGAEYADLYPNFYGIFHHVCRHSSHRHGEVKLPTLDWLGRSSLRRKCAVCERELHPIASWGATRSVFIVGGTSAGKTVFRIQLMRRLREWAQARRGARVHMSRYDETWLRERGEYLDAGTLPDATAGTVMEARGVGLVVPGLLRQSSLFLYDAPGEHFQTMNELANKQGLSKASGVILLVDPAAHDDRQAGVMRGGASHSETVGGNLLDILSGVLQQSNGMRFDIPLAIVISKADCLMAPEPLFNRNGDRTEAAVLQRRCRDAVIQLMGPNGVHMLEAGFARVQYFACSALGRSPEAGSVRNSPFQAVAVLEPLLWLLGDGASASKGRRASA